ncbi:MULTISPECIES: hypothetical protein [unclassified Nocardioides]|uniref:hypothetical protein n=1 Tax=unclassified Nocardioides TaxID=2615069 RepID=UPI003014CD90
MYLADAFAALLRQWLVALVGLLLTGAACGWVIQNVEPDYQASGQMMFLLPPEATGAATPTSPFLNLPNGLSTTGSLVAGAVATKDVHRALAADGLDATYAVALAPEAGPLLVITAKDKDPQVALATRDAVMARVAAELTRIQTEARVPKQQVISAQISNTSKQAEVLPGSRMRALAGAAGCGLLLTLLLVFGTDRFRTWRRVRRERRTEVEAAAAADDESDDEPAPAQPAGRRQRPRIAS